jgi:prepilin-type N-terminal cleavage/methylation domain-containing protein
MFKINKGFTLIELVIVITILAILATIGFVAVNNYTSKAKASADVQSASTIYSAVSRALADDKITLPAAATDYVARAVTTGATAATQIATEFTVGGCTLVASGYLQAVPELKANVGAGADRGWVVNLTPGGAVKVSSVPAITAPTTGAFQLNPKPSVKWTTPYDVVY